MPSLLNLTTAWGLVREMDLQPLREQAARQPVLAIVGKPGSGRQTLAAHLRRDPARPETEYAAPIYLLDLDEDDHLPQVDLCILLLKHTDLDDRIERNLVRKWVDAGVQVLVIINQPVETGSASTSAASGGTEIALSSESSSLSVETWSAWGKQNVLVGSVEDDRFLISKFVPVVMRLLPHQLIALARHYPLFRVPVARHLINDSCFSNVAYSFTTGMIEIVPILNIPLNVADIFVLTKNQVFLVFKLGLALGMSTRLQAYLSAFGGVLGAGFFWRQVARMLVGLIPGFGILPKVGVTYAGTYVVGSAVLQWYLTGKHVSNEQIRQLYAQAYSAGRNLASKMRPRLPRLPAGRRKAANSE